MSLRLHRHFAVRAAFFASALAGLMWLLASRLGPLPALGPFLEPRHGIWVRPINPFESDPTRQTRVTIEGLSAKVEIQVDHDQVKHIIAQTDDDLYFAQGWLLASERLWQMEFITRVAAGRLAEVFGRRSLEVDKFFIKLGLSEAAKESAALMLQDPMTSAALNAYVKGINHFVRNLKPEHVPFEYKLLEHRPEEWTPARAALLLKFMAYNLSGFSFDLPLSRSRSRLSRSDFDELFPIDLVNPEPIIPRGTRWTFSERAGTRPENEFLADIGSLEKLPQPDPSNGSNNWAVSGKKSTTGRPIVSNDIHLTLNLPSLWYEVQLISPSQNVYGIALPGAPGVILGFNRKTAWAVTNGGTDVLDWYELRFRDQKKSEYLYDSDWRPVVSHEVSIGIRGEPSETLTLRRTHFGPIVYDASETPFNRFVPKGLAMRWGALEPSNELKTFLLLNRAKSTSECRAALEGYQTPNQNFICADDSGDLGLWHVGRYPVRWKGQGRVISDGTSSEYDWKGWIPAEEVPSVRNPDRGFVSSANQAPVDAAYPHYLGWPFESPFRGLRINELLRAKEKFSPQDFVKMQGDTLSWPARAALPKLLESLHSHSFDETEQLAIEALRKWNFQYEESSTAATVFHVWYEQLLTDIWSPHFPDPSDYRYPPPMKTLDLITREPQSRWFDDPATPELEQLNERSVRAFHAAISRIANQLGRDPNAWGWTNYRPTHFQHPARIPGLGIEDFRAPGVESSIFANQGGHGPVWKSVVALGPVPKAWGVYPGGQSGDPTSRFYDNFMSDWRKNQMKELVYLVDTNAKSSRLFKTVTLTKERSP